MFKTRLTFVLILSLLTALVLSGCGSDDADDAEITVMTYNVYLGGDAESVFATPPNDPALLSKIAGAYQQIVESDYQSRAEAIAESILEHRPHLVGLQEITMLQSLDNMAMPSIDMDFLHLLEDELGDEYRTVAYIDNTTVTLPLLKAVLDPEYQADVPDGSVCPQPVMLDGCLYIRTVFADVMLARSDVVVSEESVTEENYAAALPSLNPAITATRGYVAVDATVAGTTYRVVNTHLEAYSGTTTRQAQAEELVDLLENETMPLILMGDFNSDAATDPPGAVYSLLTAAGYEDVWQGGADAGFTCCQNFDLANETSRLDRRIDHIFVRNADLVSAMTETETVGDRPEDRVMVFDMEIWPSDHAGVVARLALQPR